MADFRIVASGIADIGLGREHNEDTVLLRPDLGLFLLADGAGGHDAGNVASALATTTVAHWFESTEKEHAARPEYDGYGINAAARRISAAFHSAHHEIVEVAKATNRHRGMGTTLVAAWFEERTGRLHIANVGDSRCYRLRGKQLEPLTHDHTLLNEVIEIRPTIDDDVLAKLPRHVVTRALGMTDNIRIDVRSFEPVAGDRYLLCSDGLHGVVPDDQIYEALAIERTPEEQARLLIEMGKEAGSRDNISAVIIELARIPEILLDDKPKQKSPRIHTPPPIHLTHVTDDSTPEIVVLDEWMEGDTAEHVHVLPAVTKSRAVVDAIDGFVGPMRPKRRG